jgi:hypothetical protein
MFFSKLIISFFSHTKYSVIGPVRKYKKPSLTTEKTDKEIDSTSILNAFKNGNFSGHFRYFFMGTDNETGLTDYYANALSGLKFETAKFHNFQIGVSYYILILDPQIYLQKTQQQILLIDMKWDF